MSINKRQLTIDQSVSYFDAYTAAAVSTPECPFGGAQMTVQNSAADDDYILVYTTKRCRNLHQLCMEASTLFAGMDIPLGLIQFGSEPDNRDLTAMLFTHFVLALALQWVDCLLAFQRDFDLTA